ncbi:hypothetical protein [Hoeflea sp.]|uniref:hypothetical protein n=1 Tax=Hoeflea sp. TaxID=1940281 RepID=UPI002AFED305|nr:hypothetical protein [Hoeflea sp.]
MIADLRRGCGNPRTERITLFAKTGMGGGGLIRTFFRDHCIVADAEAGEQPEVDLRCVPRERTVSTTATGDADRQAMNIDDSCTRPISSGCKAMLSPC